MDDANFTYAYDCADTSARIVYREEAKAIDKLQRKIIEVVEGEEPYDIFICYKETDDVTKGRTEDSGIAQDIYTELISAGYKVFFSRVTLRDKAGTEYEPYIYAALKSAKVMLAIGTKFEYYDAPWVKNEWGRYLAMMQEDSSKHLIPCIKNLDAYDIPKAFKNLQALDMGDVTFYKNLMENISRFIQKETVIVVEPQSVASATATTAPLLKRMFMFLEDGEWGSANEYAEKVLDLDPECAEAYMGKLMADLKVKGRNDLAKCEISFEDNPNYPKIIRFANDALKAEVEGLLKKINERIKEKRREAEKRRQEEAEQMREKAYAKATSLIKADTLECYEKAWSLLNDIAEYKDSKELLEKCSAKIEQLKKEKEAEHLIIQTRKKENAIVKSLQTCIDAGTTITVGLKSDGTIVSTKTKKTANWRDIVAVSAGDGTLAGLRADGTVVSTKWKGVSEWENIIAISSGSSHVVGLKSDGTVVAVGNNVDGQCALDGWRNIVAIAAGYRHTVGLKRDGTVVADGNNSCGACDVGGWRNIVAIAAGSWHTVGLKADGTVVATGMNQAGQCDVSSWNDIVAVSAGVHHTVGLKSDGAVVATKYIQPLGFTYKGQCDVDQWRNIVAISAALFQTVGLKSDGTVVATGDNSCGACDVSTWQNIMLPKEYITLEQLQKIRAEQWKKTEPERKQREQYRNAGVCQHCGGELKGFLSKKCVKCGKPKDY
ncbi:MAG: TIR domain-containing protein [Clostridia bacterium]|nr:TIR domain-containing protein [Clostridia bacterium]